MMNYKITVQYDGTKYKGWQVQKSTPETIQGKLQNILSRLCGNKHMKKSTVRTVSDITISEIKDENGLKEIVIDYTGDGFLQNMIRIMTGTLIEIGSGRRSPASITQILEAKNREKAGYTAPGQGLCLLQVKY